MRRQTLRACCQRLESQRAASYQLRSKLRHCDAGLTRGIAVAGGHQGRPNSAGRCWDIAEDTDSSCSWDLGGVAVLWLPNGRPAATLRLPCGCPVAAQVQQKEHFRWYTMYSRTVTLSKLSQSRAVQQAAVPRVHTRIRLHMFTCSLYTELLIHAGHSLKYNRRRGIGTEYQATSQQRHAHGLV